VWSGQVARPGLVQLGCAAPGSLHGEQESGPGLAGPVLQPPAPETSPRGPGVPDSMMLLTFPHYVKNLKLSIDSQSVGWSNMFLVLRDVL
uniref:Uncharacterized protein n=1 Tax=Sciurus vulgaris TaxID=55149 RepID=A0A8D2DNX5_SCIVU